MALIKQFTTKNGTEIKDAYIVVEGMKYNFIRKFVIIEICIFANKEDKEKNINIIETREIVVEEGYNPGEYEKFLFTDGQFGNNNPLDEQDAVNPMHQAYLFIKGLPEFQDAVDI